MPRKVVPKQSFLGGEAGYLLKGRSDLAQFQLGTEEQPNFITLKGGAITRRPGTRFVKVTEGNLPARLIEFVVSYDDAEDMYVLEIAQDPDDGEMTLTMIRISDEETYDVNVDNFGTPWLAPDIDLNEIQYVQSADTLFLVHKNHPVIRIVRTSESPAFEAQEFRNGVEPYEAVPYRDSNVSGVTITPSDTTGVINLSASADIFNAGHVGTYFRITNGSTNGWVKINSYVGPSNVEALVIEDLGDNAATTNWQESAWSEYRGWPATITFYNNRLVFGGNDSEPDTVWASEAYNYSRMTKVDEDLAIDEGIDLPLSFTLASQKLNQIRWLVGGKKLSIGTTTSEWVGQFREDGTNLFVEFDEETTHGSAPVQPKKSAYTIPFAQRSGQVIREMVFDFNSDAFVATDLNLFASHVGTPHGLFADSNDIAIQQMALQESPYTILWAMDSVGRLYGLTRDKQQQIAAWHSHVLGGKISGDLLGLVSGVDYPAAVTSICAAPSPNGKLDRPWMVARREINGVDTYFVEYMDDIKPQPYVTAGSAGDIKAHLDCASIQTGAAATVWTGLAHFADDEVYVIAHGSGDEIVFHGILSVSGSGEITLPVAATKVCYGLHANAKVRLLPIEGGTDPEFKMNSSRSVDSAMIRLRETFGLKVGKNNVLTLAGEEQSDDLEAIPFAANDLPILATFTGIKEVSVPTDNDSDGSFTLAMEDPWPCTILSISMRAVANEV